MMIFRSLALVAINFWVQDGNVVQKNLDLAKKSTVDFIQETAKVKGNVTKAEKIINH